MFFELGDHLGSTSVVLDQATGELVERSMFQAYGGAESDYRPSRRAGFREDYRFTGKEEDVEVGLQYFGKRFLNPLLGRWVSADPLGVHVPGEADWNLYAYVRGSVVKAVDPIGLREWESHEQYSESQKQAGLEVKSHADMWAQGHWLESDRNDNTAVWKAANSHNLQTLGYHQYENIEQRADFYAWFQTASTNKGNETRWAGAASEVARGVGMMHDWEGTLSPDAATAKEVRKFAEDGNRAIFNDVFGKLRKLYNGSPLKGKAAKAWDQKTLSEEQQMVQTGYEGVSRRALKVIESSAKQSSLRLELGSWVMKKLDVIKLKGPFSGDIMSPRDRWKYGIGEMGHDPNVPMPKVGEQYRNGSRYDQVLQWKNEKWKPN